ncbi:MAG: glycoside hydrolase domain-containing protein [Verrucomicrobiia bacterium]
MKTIRQPLCCVVVCLTLLQPFLSHSQNLIKNPGFELGREKPEEWEIRGCAGEWSLGGVEGKMIAVFGNGKNSGAWYSSSAKLTNASLYHFSFYGKKEVSTTGGCAISGASTVNRDFILSEEWQKYDFYFRLPDGDGRDEIRIGQWQMMGRYYFDNCQVYPAIAIHKRIGNIELGEGESIQNGKYIFLPDFGWKGANYHRPLYFANAGFNSDRWIFSSGKEVVYKFKIGMTEQKSGRVRVAESYYTGGSIEVDISKDLNKWLTVGALDKTNRAGIWQIPTTIYPSDIVYIKLKFAGKDGSIQINTFEYVADIETDKGDVYGETFFMDIQNIAPDFTAELTGISKTNNQWKFDFKTVYSGTNKQIEVVAECLSGIEEKSKTFSTEFKLNRNRNVSLFSDIKKAGADNITVVFREKGKGILFASAFDVNLSLLEDPRPGYWIGESQGTIYWWCESGWKVGRQRSAPKRTSSQPIKISAAKGEYEAVQLVLTPHQDAELTSVEFSFQNDSENRVIPAKVNFYEVAYVPISRPTDNTCARGLYPDPLPLLKTPIKLTAGNNFTIWISFKTREFIPGGDYKGTLNVKISNNSVSIPVLLTIYDFVLPEETHLRSGFGLSSSAINRYHKLQKQEDKVAVYEKYLKNFAEHRISPYSFFDYSPIKVSFVGEGANKRAVIDFSQFDQAAEKWIDNYHFNSFRLPLRGMGGGTFQSRYLGSLEGFKEGTPEFMRLFKDYLGQVEDHLKQRGWLDKAYTYWFDEPDRKDYEFVVDGMKRIKAAAPGLKRLLTEQPEPELIGYVDIWCGLTPEWNKELVEKCKKRGEEVWWYICCGPKAPYITEFIDHPGTELRLWPWQSWQYGVQGILVWETTYWTSSLVYSNSLQNPYEDPMSYVSGYDFPVGYLGYWGNGDGRFLYPPRRDPNKTTEPSFDEPVNSFRWENLRDGMEDYEYFWLLSKHIERISKKNPQNPALDAAKKLLVVPDFISMNLTNFTTDPRLILQYRDKIARMIEQLQKM